MRPNTVARNYHAEGSTSTGAGRQGKAGEASAARPGQWSAEVVAALFHACEAARGIFILRVPHSAILAFRGGDMILVGLERG